MKFGLTPTVEEAIEHVSRARRITPERTVLALVDYSLDEVLFGDDELVFDRELTFAKGRAAPKRKARKQRKPPKQRNPQNRRKPRAAREKAVTDELVDVATSTSLLRSHDDDSGRSPTKASPPSPAAGAPESSRGGDPR